MAKLAQMPEPRGVAAGAALVGIGYAVWILSGWGGDSAIRVVDDVGLIAMAVFATVCSALAAARAQGRRRAAWICMAVGTAGWGAGEAVFSYLNLTTHVLPFPSWADVGYMMFPVGVALYLTFLLGHYLPGRRFRLLLDGVIVGAALFGAAWVTLLNTVYEARAADRTTLALSLCFPVAQLGLVTVVVLLLVRVPPAKRFVLGLVACGLVAFAFSDTAFAYLTARDYLAARDGIYHHQELVIGWGWGFLCIGVAALAVDRSPRDEPRSTPKLGPPVGIWLPYVPVALAAAICGPILFAQLGPVLIAAGVTVLAVMIRQFIVLHENRRLYADVADQALHDPLTGLANRTLFQDRLEHAMQLHEKHSLTVGVVLLDLDHFKLVNDSLGHPAGDAMLVEVAERLITATRSADTVGRLGGDEFAILTEGDADDSHATAQGVLQAFDQPFVVGSEALRVRPSVGLAIADADDTTLTADELLKRADVAMYAAKRSRSSRLFTFTPEMDLRSPGGLERADSEDDGSGASSDVRLLGELRSAIDDFGLSTVYQPKFDLRTNRVVGLEALIRWPHPRHGLMAPDQFLPLVRQHGLMRSVTTTVLDLALDDAARWYHSGIGMPVAVNVFAPAISDPELPEQITRALEKRRLPPEMLTVEITEDLLIDNMGKTRLAFNRLREAGVRIAIDDFGSGYSALWYLREFLVDEVKLDKNFIALIMTHPASALIVRAVVDLAHALDITPVAEGVEDAETAARLLEFGCEVAQGFYLSPPLQASSVQELLEAQKRGSAELAGSTDPKAPGAKRSS